MKSNTQRPVNNRSHINETGGGVARKKGNSLSVPTIRRKAPVTSLNQAGVIWN